MVAHKNHWLQILLPAALSALGWLYASYYNNDRDMVNRISALETHRVDDDSRLDRIENKLDQVIDGLHLGRK